MMTDLMQYHYELSAGTAGTYTRHNMEPLVRKVKTYDHGPWVANGYSANGPDGWMPLLAKTEGLRYGWTATVNS